ncbi:MAG: hypothetical protein ACPGYT_02115 [Nitrospirales bacterium]
MHPLSTYSHRYFQIAGIIILSGIISGCALGKCVSWDEIPVTRSMCHTGTTHDGCGTFYAANTHTTFEKVCTARLPAESQKAVVKATNP